MQHLVFAINFQIYFVILTSLVSIHFLINLSTHLSISSSRLSSSVTLSLQA